MEREMLIAVINLMFNLSENENHELEKLSDEKIEEQYRLFLLEKNEEMI